MSLLLPRHLHIVTHAYYDDQGQAPHIGGVETYITQLCALAHTRQISTTILQHAKIAGERLDHHGNRLIFWRKRREIPALLSSCMNTADDLVIYSDFYCVPPQLHHPSILLQHGIYWDNAGVTPPAFIIARLDWQWGIRKRRRRIAEVARQMDKIICVDTNFPNWLLAEFVFDAWHEKLVYIPNCVDLNAYPPPPPRPLQPERIRCLFPRRFTVFRGAVLCAEIAARLVREYAEVEFVFIGEGECEAQMRALTADAPRVSFGKRTLDEMPAEYAQADIVVIPTLASEGTSLACIEAMAAGCAIVATTIGGLTNLILPEYNGLLCAPTPQAIETALRQLLDDRTALTRYGQQARNVAERAFSRTRWEMQMLQALDAALRSAHNEDWITARETEIRHVPMV